MLSSMTVLCDTVAVVSNYVTDDVAAHTITTCMYEVLNLTSLSVGDCPSLGALPLKSFLQGDASARQQDFKSEFFLS